MREVTSEEFYNAIGTQDAIPTPYGKWDNVTGYETRWELRDRTILGYSNGATLGKKRYWLVDREYSKLNESPS